MSYYQDVYLKRLNRFGNDYQSRIQGQREKVFEDLLLKSIYRINFKHGDETESIPGILEKYKQDESRTLGYLLTRINLHLEGGEVIKIYNQDGTNNKWIVFWLENIESSGYNRYVVIKVNDYLKGISEEELKKPEAQRQYWESDCYFCGKKALSLKNDKQNQSGLYLEDDNHFNIIMPLNNNLKKGDYFEVTRGNNIYPFRVIAYDVISTQGIEFVTVNPVYKYDKDPDPTPNSDNLLKSVNDNNSDYGWFTGDFGEE